VATIQFQPVDDIPLPFISHCYYTRHYTGQFHGWDTAHDWAFGADLVKGKQMQARTRMVCRPFKETEAMLADVNKLWDDFAESCEGK
jgi:hypothetical protein